MIGNNACGSRALAYGRTADNVEARDVLRRRPTRGSGPTLSPASPRATSAPSAHGSVASPGRFRATRWNSSFRRTDVARPAPGGKRGNARRGDGGDRSPRGRSTGAGARGARLPTMAEAADAVPVLLAAAPSPVKVSTADHPLRPEPARPAAGRLALRRGHRRHVGRGFRGSGVGPPGRSAGPAVVDVEEQQALWRIREDGAGLATRPLTRPAMPVGGRRGPASGSAPTCATSRRCSASTAWTGRRTDTSATGVSTSASTSRSRRAADGPATGGSSRSGAARCPVRRIVG